MENSAIPTGSYGISKQKSVAPGANKAVEQVTNLGHAVLNSGYKPAEPKSLAREIPGFIFRQPASLGDYLSTRTGQPAGDTV